MKWKSTLASVVLAAGLVAAPVAPSARSLGVGADPAWAIQGCKLEIEVCSEVDLAIWKGTVCVTYKAFCD